VDGRIILFTFVFFLNIGIYCNYYTIYIAYFII